MCINELALHRWTQTASSCLHYRLREAIIPCLLDPATDMHTTLRDYVAMCLKHVVGLVHIEMQLSISCLDI